MLAMAIAAVAFALWASDRQVQLQGPSGLGELPDGSVWVVVNDELWHLDAQGHRVGKVNTLSAGMPRPPANLIAHDQTLYALPRGDTEVHVLDAQGGQLLRRITLQWPEDLRQNVWGALWLAVRPDGRMAVANGGGHTVTLFDDQGQYLARTRPGTFEFTNDLWWDGADVWTTNTNGHTLLRLDGDTLEVREKIEIPPRGESRYTALAAPHPRAGMEIYAPMAVLARMRNGMTQGQVLHFWRDGLQIPLPLPPKAEPRDLAWVGGKLVVVDGHSMRLMRFDEDRRALPDLGDAAVQIELAAMQGRHQQLGWAYQLGLATAVLCLLAGLGLVWRQRWQAQGPARQQAAAELRYLGTPSMPMAQRSWQALQMHGPLLVLGVPALATPYLGLPIIELHDRAARALSYPDWWTPGLATWLFMGILALMGSGLLWWWQHRLQRLAQDPAFEATINGVATYLLRNTPNWAQVARPGEHVRETLLLQRPGKLRWLILSNRRLISHVSGARERVLEAQWSRNDVLEARPLRPMEVAWWQRLLSGPGMGAWLRIQMVDGTVLQGATHSAVTAQRTLAQLNITAHQMRPLEEIDEAYHRARALHKAKVQRAAQAKDAQVRAAQAQAKLWPWQVAASALVPGAGQWWQRRLGSALLLFALFGGWVAVITLPVLHALTHVTTRVSTTTQVTAFALPLSMMLMSALDAWLMRPRLSQAAPKTLNSP
jgi:hypothetical protein